jgi:uroporphyrinogen-III decarboxylase
MKRYELAVIWVFSLIVMYTLGIMVGLSMQEKSEPNIESQISSDEMLWQNMIENKVFDTEERMMNLAQSVYHHYVGEHGTE